MSTEIEVFPAYDRSSIKNALITCSIGTVLSVAYVGYMRPLRTAPFTLSVWSIPGIMAFFLTLVASLYFLSCTTRRPRPDIVELEDNKIVLYRRTPRFAWLLVENWERRLTMWDGDAFTASCDFAIRESRTTIERSEIVRFHGKIYGEGVMARLITTTGSLDIFPWAREDDLIQVCQAISMWHTRQPWQDYARDGASELILTPFIDLSSPSPSKLVQRSKLALFVLTSLMVLLLGGFWIAEGVSLEWPLSVLIFVIALACWLGSLCLLRRPEILQLQNGSVLIDQPWGWGRKKTNIPASSINSVRQYVTNGSNDDPMVWRTELKTKSGSTLVHSHVMLDESTTFANKIAIHFAVPFYPTARICVGNMRTWADPDASSENIY